MRKVIQNTLIVLGLPIMAVSAAIGIILGGITRCVMFGWFLGWEDFWQ